MPPTHQTQTGNIHATGVVTAAVEAAVQCSRQRLPTLGQSQAANVFDLECSSRSKSGAGHDPETQSERVKLGVS